MTDEPSITTTDLSKEYGSTTAVSDVTLSVDGSQIIGVAGPSGAGKSVLTRLLLGLETPTDGEARINDVESTSMSPRERARIGYMPQHTAIYDDLTLRQNVKFFADLYDLDDPSGAVRTALEGVDLWDRRNDRMGSLSGGMIRRTSLAAAIVHEPNMLFLDEPTVGLDPRLRADMWSMFRDHRDDGALMFVSTHYLGEVHRCERVLFLRDGSVLAFDTPQAFLDRTGTENLEDAFLALLDRPSTDGKRTAEPAGGD